MRYYRVQRNRDPFSELGMYFLEEEGGRWTDEEILTLEDTLDDAYKFLETSASAFEDPEGMIIAVKEDK